MPSKRHREWIYSWWHVYYPGVGDGVNQDILIALTSVNSRLSATEARIDKIEQQIQGSLPSTSFGTNFTAASALNSTMHSEVYAEDDAAMPSAKFLKSSKNIKEAVDHRLLKLAALNEQDKFNPRGGQRSSFCKTVSSMAPKLCFDWYCPN